MKKHLILAALLGAIAPLVAPQGANAQVPTPTAPAQATAAGMTSLVFDDEFTSNTLSWSTGSVTVSGAKWYPYNWDAATSSTASVAAGTGTASGTLTITNGCIASCPTYPNTALALPPGTFSHFYAEARLQYPTNTGSTSGWPAFWSYGVAPAATASKTITVGECDFIEAIWTGNTIPLYPCNTIHNWLYTTSDSTDTANTNDNNWMSSLQGSTESAYPDANWHTYGCLWTQTGAGTGKIQFYYDNNLIVHSGGVTSFNVGAGTDLTGMENYPVCLILSTNGPAALKVNWVHVWQTTGTGTTTGSGTGTTTLGNTAQTLSSFPSTLALTTAQSPYTLPSATSAGLTPTYSVVSGKATVSSNTLTLTGTGTAVVSATQAGNSTYAAYSGTETVTITAPVTGTQTLSGFPSTLDLTMAQTPYTLPTSTSAGLTVTYTVVSGPASISGHTLTLTGAGTVVLNAKQAGNSSYSAFAATETIAVTAVTQSVASLSSSMSLTTAQSPYALPAKTDQGLALTYSVSSGPGSVSGSTLTLTGAGTVALSAMSNGNSTYAFFLQNVSIKVTSASKAGQTAQTVSGFPSTLSLTMGQTPYTLPTTTSAGLTLSYSVVSGPATVSGHTLTLNGAGTVVLAATQAGNSTYAAYTGNEAITVTTVTQTVTGFPSALSLTTAQSPYALPSTTSGRLTISYSIASGSGSVSGHTLTLAGAGTVVVRATQAGNATYAPFSGTETISVTSLSAQTVSSFPSTQSATLGSGSISLTAKTSAGQTITYTVVSGPATISGDTLKITGAGTVVIQATAAGNSTYASYTGTETITVSSGSTMTFAQWEAQPGFFTAAQVSNTAVSGPTATPQNDGVPNLLKYVYDINPAVAMGANDYAAMPVTDVDTTTKAGTTYLTLTYRQYAKLTGVTIQVQTSPDLQTWTTVAPSISHQISTDPNTGDPIIEDEVNTNGQATEFIRLNVTSP